MSGWGPQGGRISPTRIARRGSRGNSVCPCYTFRVNVAPPAPDRSVSDWHSAVETRCQPFRRISHLGFGNSGNGKRSIRRVDDRSRPLTVQNPKNCLEETLSRASAKNWSVKTERDCAAPCNRAPIRNCSRRWPRASMHGMHRYRPNSAEEVLTSANLTFRRPLNRIDSELRMNKEARMVA